MCILNFVDKPVIPQFLTTPGIPCRAEDDMPRWTYLNMLQVGWRISADLNPIEIHPPNIAIEMQLELTTIPDAPSMGYLRIFTYIWAMFEGNIWNIAKYSSTIGPHLGPKLWNFDPQPLPGLSNPWSKSRRWSEWCPSTPSPRGDRRTSPGRIVDVSGSLDGAEDVTRNKWRMKKHLEKLFFGHQQNECFRKKQLF